MEKYIQEGSRNRRRSLCKFTISNHKLKIEQGRYKNISADKRMVSSVPYIPIYSYIWKTVLYIPINSYIWKTVLYIPIFQGKQEMLISFLKQMLLIMYFYNICCQIHISKKHKSH